MSHTNILKYKNIYILSHIYLEIFLFKANNEWYRQCKKFKTHEIKSKKLKFFFLIFIIFAGSGNILPRTIWGRVISVFYIVIGFFITLVYLAVIGDYLANPFRRFYSYVTHTSRKNPSKPILRCTVPNCDKADYFHKDNINIPIWLTAMVLVTYISGGALIFNFIEKWTLLDSWYFCFLSLVTIGFGSFTPGRMENISMIATSTYILVGMALLSMCFNLIQMDVMIFFRNLYIWSEREEAYGLLSVTRIPS